MVEFLNVELYCPLLCKKQKIQLTYGLNSKGKTVFFPFNGCDFLHDCDSCNNCLKRENEFIQSVPTLEEVLDHYKIYP